MADESSNPLRAIAALFSIDVDDKGLKEGEASIESFKGKLKEFGKAFVEAFAIHELHEFIKAQVESDTQLKATAARVGSTTEELETFRLAAREASVSTGTMEASLTKLNRSLGEAREGGKAAKTFTKLGIAFKQADGHARPAADVMADLADKIAGVGDNAEKTRIATQLLGRGGAALIPLLNKGSKAFADVRAEMEKLGGYTTKEFIEHSEAAEKASVDLDVAWSNLKREIAEQLIPTFTMLVDVLTDVVAGTTKWFTQHPFVEKFLLLLGGAAMLSAVVGLGSLAVSLVAAGAAAVIAAPELYLIALAIAGIGAAWLSLSGGDEADEAVAQVDDLKKAMAGASKVGEKLTHGAGLAGKATADAMHSGETAAHHLDGALAGATNRLKGLHNEANNGGKRPLRKITSFARGRQPKTAEPWDFSQNRAASQHSTEFLPSAIPHAVRDPNGDIEYQTPDHRTPGTYAKYGPAGPAGAYGTTAAYVPEANRARQWDADRSQTGMILNQTVRNEITVNTTSDDPKAVGKAVGQGVTDGTARAMDKARVSLSKK